MRKIIIGATAWLVLVSAVHLSLNVDWHSAMNAWLPLDQRKLNVAYIPVT